MYEPEDALACTVMTDSTERSPTFSLPVFENFDFPEQVSSAVYLHLRGSPTTSQAWLRLMRRPIRGLNWDKTQLLTGNKVVLGYDFSDQVVQKRATHLGDASKTHGRVRFEIGRNPQAESHLQNYLRVTVGTENDPTQGSSLNMAFPTKWGLTAEMDGSRVSRYHHSDCPGALLLVNIFVKMLLNAHSTAIMGHLKRFEQNVMTYVAPSNYKLIDRSARYIELLLKGSLPSGQICPDYETIVRKIYDVRNEAKPGQPIVLLVRDFFLTQLTH